MESTAPGQRETLPGNTDSAAADAPRPATDPAKIEQVGRFPEFGAIRICSRLQDLPDDAAPLGESCKPDDKVSGCRFATALDAGAIRYLALGGVIRAKETDLKSGVPGPFELLRGDDPATINAKVARATGLTLHPVGEPGEAMLQSTEQSCPGNAFRLVIALDASGLASSVILTTLPSQ